MVFIKVTIKIKLKDDASHPDSNVPVIVPVFIAHQGCPHRCLYCNEDKVADPCPARITETYLRTRINSCLQNKYDLASPRQIAFYGGNFTGLELQHQQELLELASIFIKEGLVESIRISTRPDYINADCLDLLQSYKVRTVEIGAQSLKDDVLRLSRRGHTADQVRKAVKLLLTRGFETGIHLMAGLPGDDREGFAFSVEETIALHPHTVRIHPTLVLAGTELAEIWARGDYRPLTLSEAIDVGKYALEKFTAAGIPVIRLGLQTTPEMEKPGTIAAGPYHPAFRSLVEEALFLDLALNLLVRKQGRNKDIVFSLAPRDESSFRGHNNGNIRAIIQRFGLNAVSLAFDPLQPRGSLALLS